MKLKKTQAGLLAFKQRSPLLSARQRAVFLICDGNQTAAAIVSATAQLGVNMADIEHLMAQGFVYPVVEPNVEPASVLSSLAQPGQASSDMDSLDEDPADFPRWTMF